MWRFDEVPRFQVRVPSEGSIVPHKGSGLRVLGKFQVKLPEGSKVPSKGSK